LKTSRKIAAAIGTGASGVLRRRRLKSKIVNAPKIPSPAMAAHDRAEQRPGLVVRDR
jgi:hypothetical protein